MRSVEAFWKRYRPEEKEWEGHEREKAKGVRRRPPEGGPPARAGGSAHFLIEVRRAEELKAAARSLWAIEYPFRVIGGGSNVLVADEGVREAVILNEAKAVRAFEAADGPRLWGESGAPLGG